MTPTQAVDVTSTVDRAVDSLAEHARYLAALSETSVREQAQVQVDMVSGPKPGFDADHGRRVRVVLFLNDGDF